MARTRPNTPPNASDKTEEIFVSHLNPEKTYSHKDWLISLVYKENSGVMVLLEGASALAKREYASVFTLQKGDKLQALDVSHFDFHNSYYQTFDLAEEKARNFLKLIGKVNESDGSDSDDEMEKAISSLTQVQKALQGIQSLQVQAPTLFSANTQADPKNQRRDHIAFKNMRSMLHDESIIPDANIPKSIELFKLDADYIKPEPSVSLVK